MNHPFLDANKRTGILSGVVFMDLNGRGIIAEIDTLYQTAVGVENKSIDFHGLAEWYDTNCLPLTEPEMEEMASHELWERYGPFLDE